MPVSPDDYDPRPYIASQTWTYAKTVPNEPHEYLAFHASTDKDEHRRMTTWVARSPRRYRFRFDPADWPDARWAVYRYRLCDGYRYWVSSIRGGATFLNRTPGEPDASDPNLELLPDKPPRKGRAKTAYQPRLWEALP